MVLGALALKVCKKYYYEPTKNFCKNWIWVPKHAEFYADFVDASLNARKIVICKTFCKFWIFFASLQSIFAFNFSCNFF